VRQERRWGLVSHSSLPAAAAAALRLQSSCRRRHKRRIGFILSPRSSSRAAIESSRRDPPLRCDLPHSLPLLYFVALPTSPRTSSVSPVRPWRPTVAALALRGFAVVSSQPSSRAAAATRLTAKPRGRCASTAAAALLPLFGLALSAFPLLPRPSSGNALHPLLPPCAPRA
jgi:hypothetical protein